MMQYVCEYMIARTDKPVLTLTDWTRDRDQNIALATECPSGERILSWTRQAQRRILEKYPRNYFGAIILSEAHRVPFHADSDYRVIFSAHPQACIIGFSATPYRFDTGPIAGGSGFFTRQITGPTIRECVKLNHLSPIRPLKANHSLTREQVLSLQDLNEREQENYDQKVDALTLRPALAILNEQITELVAATTVPGAAHKHVLIFCINTSHAEHTLFLCKQRGLKVGLVSYKTPETNADVIAAFERGELTYLINVNMLSTSYNFPAIDCVVLLRPYTFKGTYVQAVGRGIRMFPNKVCLVLDFAGNRDRFGDLDDWDDLPMKEEGVVHVYGRGPKVNHSSIGFAGMQPRIDTQSSLKPVLFDDRFTLLAPVLEWQVIEREVPYGAQSPEITLFEVVAQVVWHHAESGRRVSLEVPLERRYRNSAAGTNQLKELDGTRGLYRDPGARLSPYVRPTYIRVNVPSYSFATFSMEA